MLTTVTGYSRWLSAVLFPSRTAEDLFAGWWQLIGALGAVPQAAGLGRRGRGRPVSPRRQPGCTADCQAFRGTLATRVYVCLPRYRSPRPDRAGERLPGPSFLPGRAFTCPADFNLRARRLAGGGQHPAGAGHWDALRRTGSLPTGRRRRRCRRWRRPPAGGRRPGWPAITTSGPGS